MQTFLWVELPAQGHLLTRPGASLSSWCPNIGRAKTPRDSCKCQCVVLPDSGDQRPGCPPTSWFGRWLEQEGTKEMWKRKRKRGVGAGIKGADGRKGQGWRDTGKEGDRGKEQEGKRKGMETQQFWFWKGGGSSWAIFMDPRAADLHVSSLFAYWGQKVPTPHVRRNRNSLMQPSGKLFKRLASDLPR